MEISLISCDANEGGSCVHGQQWPCISTATNILDTLPQAEALQFRNPHFINIHRKQEVLTDCRSRLRESLQSTLDHIFSLFGSVNYLFTYAATSKFSLIFWPRQHC